VNDAGLAFYASPGAMSRLPDAIKANDVPTDLDSMRCAVQSLLVHRNWVEAYGLVGDAIRLDEQNIRSTADTLTRALELSSAPINIARPPIERVQGICRHFALVQVAFLRAHGIPARMRCGFANYFDRAMWCDHWITERWNGDRWVRDDPQVDDVQAKFINLGFDVNDQPLGEFMSANEAWRAARGGEIDPMVFGIFDMWGYPFIAGNVVSDFACINKVELLPWDRWSPLTNGGPFTPVADDTATVIDELSALMATDDFDAIRRRYLSDDRLRVPAEITTFNGPPTPVLLDLDD
jgi:hypothetical protein